MNESNFLSNFEQQTVNSYSNGQMRSAAATTEVPSSSHVSSQDAAEAARIAQAPTGLFNDPIVSSTAGHFPQPTGPTINQRTAAPHPPAMDATLTNVLQQLSDRLARLENNGHAPVPPPPVQAPVNGAQPMVQKTDAPAPAGFKFASVDDVSTVWKLAGRAKKEHPDVVRKRVVMLARKQGFALPKEAIQWLTDISKGKENLSMPFERRAHRMAAFMRASAEFSSFLSDEDRRGAFEGMVNEQMTAWLSDPDGMDNGMNDFFFSEQDEQQNYATADAEIAQLLEIAQYILEEEGFTPEEAKAVIDDMTPGNPQAFAEKKASDSDGEDDPLMFEFELDSLSEEELKELEEELGDKFEKFALQQLASRTKKGNVTAAERKKSATLSKGRFPIFDKRSALAALKLRGHAKSSAERSKIISRAARFAPEAAKTAREADKKEKNSDAARDMMSLAQAIAAETGGTAEQVFADLFSRSDLAKGDA